MVKLFINWARFRWPVKFLVKFAVMFTCEVFVCEVCDEVVGEVQLRTNWPIIVGIQQPRTRVPTGIIRCSQQYNKFIFTAPPPGSPFTAGPAPSAAGRGRTRKRSCVHAPWPHSHRCAGRGAVQARLHADGARLITTAMTVSPQQNYCSYSSIPAATAMVNTSAPWSLFMFVFACV